MSHPLLSRHPRPKGRAKSAGKGRSSPATPKPKPAWNDAPGDLSSLAYDPLSDPKMAGYYTPERRNLLVKNHVITPSGYRVREGLGRSKMYVIENEIERQEKEFEAALRDERERLRQLHILEKREEEMAARKARIAKQKEDARRLREARRAQLGITKPSNGTTSNGTSSHGGSSSSSHRSGITRRRASTGASTNTAASSSRSATSADPSASGTGTAGTSSRAGNGSTRPGASRVRSAGRSSATTPQRMTATEKGKGKGKGKGQDRATAATTPGAAGKKQVPSIQAAIDKLGQDYNSLYLSNSQDQQGHLPPNDMVYDETRAGDSDPRAVADEVVETASAHGPGSDTSHSSADSPRSHKSSSGRSRRSRRSSSGGGGSDGGEGSSSSSSSSSSHSGARGDIGSSGLEGQAGAEYNNDDAHALLLGSTSSTDTTPSTHVYTASKPAPASPPPRPPPAAPVSVTNHTGGVRTSKSTSRVHTQQLLPPDQGDRNRAQSAEQPGSRDSAAQKKAISQNKRAAAVVVKRTRSRPSSGASRSSVSRALSRQSIASHTS